MKPDMFERPVSILVGLGFPGEIRSVMDAYRLLVDWQAPSGDALHSVAIKACLAALRGEVEAETVRGLFVAFAERHHLLAPAMDASIPSAPPAFEIGIVPGTAVEKSLYGIKAKGDHHA
ncbi:DUF982 domain-containing protein [Ensifer sp. ENS08]|uniref:DUF982 domain-containing protein n=1 Tax=Ensifer sp. ENS08 TaxID=2769273 RepID=UPI0017806BA9|nr:DUF982 domain-containing protein [Ensifer sp. ENS08]MBD9572831.1 DUF982 domain-containing protein [Ensifer sp. ENS08]